MRAPCKIDGCDKESRGRGWCSTHWLRWRKYGDPLYVKKNGIDFNVKARCGVEGCGRPNHARLLCDMHLSRYQKHGDPTVVMPIAGRPLKGDAPKFSAIHKRLERTRGRASNFACIDCGGTAREWSYNNADPDELHELMGAAEVPYSLDLANYDPRCTSCHRTFDGAGANRNRDAAGRFLPDVTVICTPDVEEAAA